MALATTNTIGVEPMTSSLESLESNAGTGMSFLSLLEVHDHLTELFLLHQEALLVRELDLAAARLSQFEHELRRHMQIEEELLLPVYARAGRIPGGPIEFYTGEHKKMLGFLTRFAEKLNVLNPEDPKLDREIIELFDDQATFKNLMEHHDSRERTILYPTLDEVTDDRERAELLGLCISQE